MQLTPWNTSKIAQYNQQTKQALLSDESTLVSFSQDFGKLMQAAPAAVCIPENSEVIQSLLHFASNNQLPVTIRGNGLSQNGQSLPVFGGLTLSMQNFNKVLDISEDCIWVEANASWSALLAKTLPKNKSPYIVPYNCNLSVGGVLSAGGIGASSFKYGSIAAHVQALEVIDGRGKKQLVDHKSPLFHACLGGQGRFGVITKAAIQLRSVSKFVKTFCLVYLDSQSWFKDWQNLKEKADYLELFCSPSLQGMKLTESGRVPLVQWLYGLQVTVEWDKESPALEAINKQLSHWKIINTQEEGIASYLERHNIRFEGMKRLGQWDSIHPWYECFVPTAVLEEHLQSLLEALPIYYASFVQIVPIAKHQAGFLKMPEGDSISAFMILNPGVGEPLKQGCLKAIETLDTFFLSRGGKRYLSGYLGENLTSTYWQKHFGEQYEEWVKVKKQYDPSGIFCSLGG